MFNIASAPPPGPTRQDTHGREREGPQRMEAGTVGHLEDSLSSQPLCQQKQDLGVETATAVHIPHHGGEHLLRSVDSKAEMGR